MRMLGFDLGDGESAVTLLDDTSTIEPRSIPLCGRASILTAVGLKDGQIVIGEEASVSSGAMWPEHRMRSFSRTRSRISWTAGSSPSSVRMRMAPSVWSIFHASRVGI